MQRRDFLVGAGMLAVGLLSLKAGAAEKVFCDGDVNQPLEGEISNNHAHRLLVPRQDVLDGKDKSYDIHGNSSHGHIVIVTEELFAELRKTGRASVESGATGGHKHVVTLICAN